MSDLRERVAAYLHGALAHTGIKGEDIPSLADGIFALFDDEIGKHDCDRWAEEGIGCAICNPIARYSRNLWDDPIRKRCEVAEALEAELREALEDLLDGFGNDNEPVDFTKEPWVYRLEKARAALSGEMMEGRNHV